MIRAQRTAAGRAKRFAAALLGSLPIIAAFPAAPAELLSDDDLAGTRAGYITVDGISFDFGAQLKTFIDGTLALSSQLTLNDSGLKVVQNIGDIPTVVPLSESAAAGLNLGNIQGDGIVVLGEGGGTALIQGFSDSQLQNLVINTANNRTITQETSLTFTIQNLPDIQTQMQLHQIALGLEAALNASLLAIAH